MKRIINVMVALAVVFALTVSCYAAGVSFKDVPAGKWYTKGVHYVAEKGFMQGIDKTRFDPNGKLTRAQVAQILYAMEGKPKISKSMFKDIPSGKWYTNAVNWAGAVGMMSGYEDGKFGPKDYVTRQQLAAVMYKYARSKNLDMNVSADISKFKDAKDVSSWAVEQMKWCVGAKLITGTNKGLEPKATVTRAQMAVILMAFDQLKPISDNPAVTDDITPYIGENGNWWIGNKDTGIAAAGKNGKDGKDGKNGIDGKDGETPSIGENGNWWIAGKDTGVKAAAEVKETEKLEIGDSADILPGKSFSWVDENKNEIVVDSIDVSLYAKENYEELSRDRAMSFFRHVPSDTTYSNREYWYEDSYYHPYVFRTGIAGHADKKLAGKMVEVLIDNIDTNSGYYLIALIEKDGTFHCVHYAGMYGTRFSFSRADILKVSEDGRPNLKAFDDVPSTVRVSYGAMDEIENAKNISFILKGKDIHGKDFSMEKKLDTKKDYIDFTDVSASGKNGYSLFAKGVLNTAGEKKIDEGIVSPGSYAFFGVSMEDLIDSRKGTVIIPVDNKINKAYFKDGRTLGVRLVGTDINGISRSEYFSIDAGTTELVFENVVYSDKNGYHLEIDYEGVFELYPNTPIKVDAASVKANKVTIQASTYELTIPVEASDGIVKGIEIRVYGTGQDGTEIDKTLVTDDNGTANIQLPCGDYTIDFISGPSQYDMIYIPESNIWWLSQDYTTSPIQLTIYDEGE